MTIFTRAILLAGLILATLAGSPSSRADNLTIFAAASLKNAMDDIAGAWKTGGGAPIAASYASSSVLAKQIEQGAPADIFISADTQWMDYLDRKSLVENPRPLLGNRLVLISAKDNPLSLEIKPGLNLAELLGGGRLAVGDPSNVPAGIYAKESLTNLKIWDSVQSKLAPAADVRAALVLVSRGEAPLGIVYETDAKIDPNVRIVAVFPENSHKAILYPVAVIKTSHNPDAAKFVAFLNEPVVQAIFTKYGFTILVRK